MTVFGLIVLGALAFVLKLLVQLRNEYESEAV